MPFDVDGAKASGYSDAEIADYLSNDQKFDAQSARQAGYSDQEIIQHLSAPAPAPTPDEPPSLGAQTKETEGLFSTLTSALKTAASDVVDKVKSNIKEDADVVSDFASKLPTGDAVLGRLQGGILKSAGGLEVLGANSLDNDNLYYAKLYDDEADAFENGGRYHGRQEDKDYVKSLRDQANQLRTMGQADLKRYQAHPEERPMYALRSSGSNLIAAGEDTLDVTQPKNPNAVERAVLGTVGAVPTLAAGAVGGIMGGPGAALAAMGTNTAGESYADVAKNPNLTEEQKQNYAAASAGIGTVLNALPVSKAMGAGSLVQRFLKSLAFNVPTQEANTVAQHALAKHEGIDQEWTDEQWAQAIIDSAAQAGLLSAGHAATGSVGPAKRTRETEQVNDMMANKDALSAEMFPEKPAAPAAPKEVTETATTPESTPEPPPAKPTTPMQQRRAEVQQKREAMQSEAVAQEAAPDEVVVKPGKGGYTVHIAGSTGGTFRSEALANTEAEAIRQAIRTDTLPKGSGIASAKVLGQEVEAPATPTPAQAEAGNYRKPEVQWQGLPIKIENLKGSVRTGPVDEGTGKPQWATTQHADYGYLKGSVASDKEGVDVYMGGHPDTGTAYVIDQLTPDGKRFDEPKVVVGVRTKAEARSLYLKHYPEDWKGVGAITPMSSDELKQWAYSDAARKPVAWTPPEQARSTARAQSQHDSILEYLSKTTLHGAESRGLSVAAMKAEGLDPAEMRGARGHGINRPFTMGGGSLDHAAEILSEAGYPVNGKDGKPDANKLLDLITAEIRQGKRVTANDNTQFKHEEDKYLNKYHPIDDDELGSLSDAKLDEHIAALEEMAKQSPMNNDDWAEFDQAAGVFEKTNKYSKQTDLFGDKVALKNELKRLEVEKDRRRNSGQESVETGKPNDLFSESRKQTSIEEPRKPYGDDEKNLVITHNLSAEKLMHADHMGGLAVPSLSISKADHAQTGYGDITLIGHKEMADPKGYAKTKVFGADVYSPRYPTIHIKLDKFALKRLNRELAPHRKENERDLYPTDITEASDLVSEDAFKKYAEAQGVTDYHGKRSLAENLLRKSGATEHIYRGYTNSGNRSYKPHTLENVVNILKKEIRGGENFNYGVGSLRAHFTPQFTTVKQIVANKDKLISSDDFEKIKEEVDKDFWSLANSLGTYHPYNKSFSFGDTVISTLQDAAKMGLNRALKENQFSDVPDDVKQQAVEFLERLRHFPTEYFEAKIPRAVSLSEFAGAVVPDDAPQEALNTLKQNGVAIKTYKSGDEQDRRAAVESHAKSLGNAVFEDQHRYGDVGPLWRSTLTEAVNSAKLEKSTGAQWLSTLQNMPGVKREEIDATDLAEFLGDRKGVTKQEIAEYLASNGVQVHESNLANPDEIEAELTQKLEGTGFSAEYSPHDQQIEIVDEEGSAVDYDELPENVQSLVDQMKLEGETKFQKYTTPGGENYRELLLTLPQRGDGRTFEQWLSDTGRSLPDYRTDEIPVLRAQFDRESRRESKKNFHSGHWDQPNVLAHIRFDVRTDTDGKKVMHIAEVQSDWHQKGRKQGYESDKKQFPEIPPAAELEVTTDEHSYLVSGNGYSVRVGKGVVSRPSEAREYAHRYFTNNRRQSITDESIRMSGAVPDAPFKTTWPELSMKRAIRWAAENDIDRITWDNGETQADRYDLSKRLEAVTYKKDGDRYFIEARQLGAHEHEDVGYFTESQLPDAVGKELAEKIVSGDGRQSGFYGDDAGKKTLDGLDLKVGGSGMRSFYDKILPATVNKLIKKHGSQVQLNKFNIGATSKDPELDILGPYAHGFDITPSMRAEALKGQALFESQLAFGFDDPYQHLEVRPGTTEKQKAVGRKSLADVEKRIFGKKNSVFKDASLLASRVTADFRDTGFTSFVGQHVSSMHELALVAQIARHPSFEHFRFILTDNTGKVVDELSYGCRLAGTVRLPHPVEATRAIRQRMQLMGASRFYMMHNHPSGTSIASRADIAYTDGISKQFDHKEFGGHVIIDFNEYSVIEKSADGLDTRRIEAPWLKGLDMAANPEAPHELLQHVIDSNTALAEAAKKLNTDKKMVTIISTTARGKIAMVSEIPFSNLDLAKKTRMQVRRGIVKMKLALQRTGSAGHVFAVVPGDTHLHAQTNARSLERLNLFTDILDYEGNGLGGNESLNDVFGSNPTKREEAGGKVREETMDYDDNEQSALFKLQQEKARREKADKIIHGQSEADRRKGLGPKGYRHARNLVSAIPQSEFIKSFRRLIDPVNLSGASKHVAAITRAELGWQAQEREDAIHQLERYATQIDQLSPQVKLDIIHAIETGSDQPMAAMQPAADTMRKMLDTWREKIQSLGEGYLDDWIENYFPHYWQQEDAVVKFVRQVASRRPLRGPATFLKKRTIPTVKEGMDAGLKPLTINPLILAFLKVHEMQRFYTGVKLMQKFKEEGLARFIKSGKPTPEGWVEIKDAVGRIRSWSEAEGGFVERGRYVMPEDGARIINNHLSGSALKNFLPAQVFRTASNALNSLQLSFSGFHIGFTTLDAIISKNALGIERLFHGEPLKAAAAFTEGLTGPVAAGLNIARGYKLLKAYSNVGDSTPDMKQLVDMLQRGGGRVKMDTYFMAAQGVSPFKGIGFHTLAGDIRRAMTQPHDKVTAVAKTVGSFVPQYATKLWQDLRAIGVEFPKWQIPFEIAGRITRASSALIMEHIVPMQKLGVFSDLAADYLRRHPDATPEQLNEASQRIWDSVDNRLGEMVYDNVFWNRTFKDCLHFGIRAVGWNLGTVREIGGAPVDALRLLDKAVSEGKVNSDEVGHKIPYVLAMTMTTMIAGAVLQYLMTGKGPDEPKDYFFPKTGGKTRYNTPQRVSLPSYAKDVYEYANQPGQTVINKLNPIYSLINEVWNNEDFFGNAIYEPESSTFEKSKQVASFMGRAALPFSMQSGRELAGSEEPGVRGALKKTLPIVGVGVAPGRVSSPEQMERSKAARDEQSYVNGLRKRLQQAQDAGDTQKADKLSSELEAAKQRARELRSEVNPDWFVPASVENGRKDPVVKAMATLGIHKLPPQHSIQGIELTQDEYKSLKAAVSSAGYTEVLDMVEDKTFIDEMRNDPDTARAELNRRWDQAVKSARFDWMEDHEDLSDRVRDQKQKSKVPNKPLLEDTVGMAAPINSPKDKYVRVAALRDAGAPALATLVNSLPIKPRPAVLNAIRRQSVNV